jgi:rRNA processing protein Gar1
VLHVSASHNLILRFQGKSLEGVNIGATVYDKSSKKVGIVKDIFGPISKPYVAIKPQSRDAPNLVGRELFVQ